MNKRIVAFMLAVLVISPTVTAKEIQAICTSGIAITLSIEEKVRTFSFFDNYSFSNTLPVVLGVARISNPTNSNKLITTSDVKVSFNKLPPSRAYKQSIASEEIDSTSIVVPPGSSLKLKVYWAPKLSVGNKISKMDFTCESREK